MCCVAIPIAKNTKNLYTASIYPRFKHHYNLLSGKAIEPSRRWLPAEYEMSTHGRSGWKPLLSTSKWNNSHILKSGWTQSDNQLCRRWSTVWFYHGFDIEFTSLIRGPDHGARCNIPKSLSQSLNINLRQCLYIVL